MIVKLLTEHHLEFLGLKGGCRGSSESTLVKMPNCWKSHAVAQSLFTVSLFPFDTCLFYGEIWWKSFFACVKGLSSIGQNVKMDEREIKRCYCLL